MPLGPVTRIPPPPGCPAFGVRVRRRRPRPGRGRHHNERGEQHVPRHLLRVGAGGLLIGGLWEYRGGELFGGTFGVGYAGFLFSTALIYKVFAGPMTTAARVANFDHAFAAWLILWALFTATFAFAATSISWTAVAPFTLAFIVPVVLAIANLGGTASRTTDVAKIGGWVGILDSFAAGYLGAALVINISVGKALLPLFPKESPANPDPQKSPTIPRRARDRSAFLLSMMRL